MFERKPASTTLFRRDIVSPQRPLLRQRPHLPCLERSRYALTNGSPSLILLARNILSRRVQKTRLLPTDLSKANVPLRVLLLCNPVSSPEIPDHLDPLSTHPGSSFILLFLALTPFLLQNPTLFCPMSQLTRIQRLLVRKRPSATTSFFFFLSQHDVKCYSFASSHSRIPETFHGADSQLSPNSPATKDQTGLRGVAISPEEINIPTCFLPLGVIPLLVDTTPPCRTVKRSYGFSFPVIRKARVGQPLGSSLSFCTRMGCCVTELVRDSR